MAKRVLVAIADDGGRGALRAALSEEGYAVAEASSGAETVDVAHRLQPDALVLDGRFADTTAP